MNEKEQCPKIKTTFPDQIDVSIQFVEYIQKLQASNITLKTLLNE